MVGVTETDEIGAMIFLSLKAADADEEKKSGTAITAMKVDEILGKICPRH